ncbi:MAG: tetratricopeptide repeat protein, partial [Chloroflexota bacterium]
LSRGAERIFAQPPEPLETEPARDGETLILIPEFQGDQPASFEVRLRDQLQTRIAAAQLQNVRVVYLRQSVFGPDDDDAIRRLAARYGAAFVIWGWFDLLGGGFQARFTTTDALVNYQQRDPEAFQMQVRVDRDLYTSEDLALFIQRGLPQQVDFFIFFVLGQLHYWDRQYARALNALTRAIDAGSVLDTPPHGLAYAYFYRGNLHAFYLQNRPAAIADYRAALSYPPPFVNAAFNLGQALRAWGEAHRLQHDESQMRAAFVEAREAYTQAITIDTQFAPAYEARGLTHAELGDDSAAIRDYERALALRPQAETFNKLGLVLIRRGDLDNARVQFDQAIAHAPDHADYYYNRALLAVKRGQTESVVPDFVSYLQLAPHAPDRARVTEWLKAHGGSVLDSNGGNHVTR